MRGYGRSRDKGEGSIEYVAIVAILSMLFTSIMGTQAPQDVDDEFEEQVCRVIQVEGCPDGDGGDGEDGEDGEDPEDPETGSDRWASIPCVVARQSRYRAWDLYLPRFIVAAGSASEGVEQVGPDRFRVTVTGENRLGVGTFTGDPPGNRDSRSPFGRPTGEHGIGSLTVGGRTATTYEFASREEAEDFLESRRGGWRGWLAAVTGVHGHVVEEGIRHGWRWLRDRVTDVVDRDEPEPEEEEEEQDPNAPRGGEAPRFYTAAVNPRVAASGGYNAGRIGGAGLSGGATLDEALTMLNDPGNRVWIHSASAELGVGATLYPPQFINAGPVNLGAYGVGDSFDTAVRYRYISQNGEPRRLVLVWEYTFGAHASGGTGVRDTPDGDRYRGGGLSATGRLTQTRVFEAHLDLTVPENREAFERTFLTTGQLAHPRALFLLAQPHRLLADAPDAYEAMQALWDRFEEDGAFARFAYSGHGRDLGGGFASFPGRTRGGTRGMWGVFPSTGDSERELDSAEFRDARTPGSRYEPLRSCTESSSGFSGITPNTGGSRAPSTGGQQGTP